MVEAERKNRRRQLIDIIWKYIQKYNANIKKTDPELLKALKVTKKDIEDSVFYMEGEHRISGEADNNFSLFFVNYYDGQKSWSNLMDHLSKHGWETDWYNPGYMVTYYWG